jgi:hypothetical protein
VADYWNLHYNGDNTPTTRATSSPGSSHLNQAPDKLTVTPYSIFPYHLDTTLIASLISVFCLSHHLTSLNCHLLPSLSCSTFRSGLPILHPAVCTLLLNASCEILTRRNIVNIRPGHHLQPPDSPIWTREKRFDKALKSCPRRSPRFLKLL